MYYVDGDYGARKGVDVGTHHPAPVRPPARAAAGDGREGDRQEVDERARRDVRHVPAAQADEPLARPRRALLRVLVVGVPGDGVTSGLHLARRRARHRLRPRARGRGGGARRRAGLRAARPPGARWPWRPRSPRRRRRCITSGRGPCRRSPRRHSRRCRRATGATWRSAAAGWWTSPRRSRPRAGRERARWPCPTTLSGAELTRVHRHADGVDDATPRVRCALVVCDPALAASQPEEELAASALNALAHAAEAPCTVGANPVSTLAAHHAARLLVGAYGPGTRPLRPPGGRPTATRWRSAPCSPATRWTRRATACTTCSRRPSSSAAWPRTGPRTRCCSRTRWRRSPGARRGSSQALADAHRAGAGGGRRAPLRAHGRDAAARSGDHGGGPRRVRGHRGGAPAARPHAAARGPRGDPRGLRRRMVTRAPALRARTGVTIL